MEVVESQSAITIKNVFQLVQGPPAHMYTVHYYTSSCNSDILSVQQYHKMHLQYVYSVNGVCKSRLKPLRLHQRFYILPDHTSLGLRSPTFATIMCGRMKILMRFHLTISNDIIPPTCGLEISGDYFNGPHTLPARASGCD
jgi:hypothetical protein